MVLTQTGKREIIFQPGKISGNFDQTEKSTQNTWWENQEIFIPGYWKKILGKSGEFVSQKK